MRYVHSLTLPLVFPHGVAPGEGSSYNVLRMARNGVGQTVLRGTSFAGVLRHAYSDLKNDSNAVKRIFGEAPQKKLKRGKKEEFDEGFDSPLKVADSVLDFGQAPFSFDRTHHLRNRHTKHVVDSALFSIEVCPPQTATSITLWLHPMEDNDDSEVEFLQFVVNQLNKGLLCGGNSARGIGLVQLSGPAMHRRYDLSDLQQHSQYLDDHWKWRRGDNVVPTGSTELATTDDSAFSGLEINLSLGIPRGQDLLIGDGQGLDYEIEPQRVAAADGHEYWRIPGSSLRGVFKQWMTHLAAREGKTVADNVKRQKELLNPDTDRITGENLGWCFLPVEERGHLDDDQENPIKCPIASLFGSLMESGRIWIPDALTRCGEKNDRGYQHEQARMHVAVDRITGGAAESMLFQNTVLTHGLQFDVQIRVKNPEDYEIDWLVKTIVAMDIGILRVGTSKSAGRLALCRSPQASLNGETVPALEEIELRGMSASLNDTANKSGA